MTCETGLTMHGAIGEFFEGVKTFGNTNNKAEDEGGSTLAG